MEFSPIWLTLKLAGITVVILLLIGTPMAWWLATTHRRFKPVIESVVALPLVLPPTVLGFYMLILLSPNQPLGSLWLSLTGGTLTFSFTGLVLASVIYSLPFVVQPLQTAFAGLGQGRLEAAATLGATPLDAFFTVISPLAVRGYITAIILGFAHTVGEFGVVLMVGGNIPERTRVISIAIYEQVETLNYTEAHILSSGLLVFSFLVLLVVYMANRRTPLTLSGNP
jgi:molybdate transport system permease protein